MKKFLRHLRAIGNDPLATSDLFARRFRLRVLDLRIDDWDSDYDTDMLVGLGHWYYQREHYHDTFDWTTELSPDQFRVFVNSYQRTGYTSPGSPGTTPTTPTAATVHVPAAAPTNLFGAGADPDRATAPEPPSPAVPPPDVPAGLPAPPPTPDPAHALLYDSAWPTTTA
jgi:hypothetical protein